MALREVFARFTTQFNGTALRRGNAQVQGLTGRLSGAIGSIRAMGAAFAGLAIVQIIRSWISAAQDFVDSMRSVGDELDKTSRVIGISSAELQEWRHAANLSGVEASSFSQGLVRLQNNMRNSLITPTSSAALAFQRLGVDLRDGEGQLRNVSDVLTDMADPLANLQSDSERVAILTALMGRSGARMGPLFEQGRAGVEAMRGELEQLGGGASQEMIEQAARLTDEQARLDLSLLSLKSRIAVLLLPAISDTIQAFTGWVAQLSQNERFIRFLQAALITLAGIFVIVAIITAPAWLPILLIVVAVTAAIAFLILVVEDLITWFEGGNSVIGQFVDALLEMAGISMVEVRNEIQSVFDALTNGYNAIAEAVGLPTISTGPANVDTSRAGPKREGASSTAAPLTGGARFLQQLRVAGAGTRAPGAASSITSPAFARNNPGGVRSVTNAPTFNISGADPETIAAEVGRVLDRTNRDAVEALGQ